MEATNKSKTATETFVSSTPLVVCSKGAYAWIMSPADLSVRETSKNV